MKGQHCATSVFDNQGGRWFRSHLYTIVPPAFLSLLPAYSSRKHGVVCVRRLWGYHQEGSDTHALAVRSCLPFQMLTSPGLTEPWCCSRKCHSICSSAVLLGLLVSTAVAASIVTQSRCGFRSAIALLPTLLRSSNRWQLGMLTFVSMPTATRLRFRVMQFV